jgi:phosphoribosylanthranilate isomerase
MARILTQIYEISSPDEARAISTMGVDHIGVLVGDGEFPREQPLSKVRDIAAAVVSGSKLSALFLTARTDFIIAWVRELNPAILHLGAAPELLGPDQVSVIKDTLPGPLIMRSVPVVNEDSMRIAQAYERIADYLLLDSHRASDKQIGALGITHDWSISRRIVERVRTPIILAGGLGPDNVADAIRAVQPAGVDSNTKTDQDDSHAKDLERIKRFREAALTAVDGVGLC